MWIDTNRPADVAMAGSSRTKPALSATLLAAVLATCLGTGQAFAQFGMMGGRGGDAMRHEGMRHEGGRGVGAGIGLGIIVGIGEALIDKAVQDSARNGPKAEVSSRATGSGLAKSRHPAKRTARQETAKAATTHMPAKTAARRRTARMRRQPRCRTIPRTASTCRAARFHRGTGTITGYKGGPRPGIYCWVHTTDKQKVQEVRPVPIRHGQYRGEVGQQSRSRHQRRCEKDLVRRLHHQRERRACCARSAWCGRLQRSQGGHQDKRAHDRSRRQGRCGRTLFASACSGRRRRQGLD